MNAIAELVRRLYLPSIGKEEVNAIQSELLQAQKSAAGWDIANQLLEYDDQNIRFFGALTFTVKINQDGHNLNEDEVLLLLNQLLTWLIRLIGQEEGPLVIRKLCSTLGTTFLLPRAPWKRCVRHMTQCLVAGHVVPELPAVDDLWRVALSLQAKQLHIILTFANILAEDAARVEHTTYFGEVHQRVEANVADVSLILQTVLSRPDQGNNRGHALQCYQAWVIYARDHIPDSSEQMQSLRVLLGETMGCLIQEDTYEAAAEFFTDMFVNGDSILTKESLDQFGNAILQSSWAHSYLHAFQLQEIDEDASIFGQLVLAFAQHICNRLVLSPFESQPILDIMHGITRSQNFDNVDQALSNAIVDFWEEYASQVETSQEEGSATSEAAREQWLLAVEELCVASRLPVQGNEFEALGQDNPLAEFRLRVKDAVQSSYDDFGVIVLQKLISMALQMHDKAKEDGLDGTDQKLQLENAPTAFMEALSILEAVFNCMGGLADSMQYQANDSLKLEEDTAMQNLFSSAMYADLTNLDIPIPSKLRKRVINTLGEHVKFLGRNAQYLLRAIDVLLKCLVLPEIMESTARAISTLCDGNRHKLVSRLDLFLDVSEQFFAYAGSQQESQIYMAGAVASIVQAAPPGDQQGIAIQRLLAMIERSFTLSVDVPTIDAEETTLDALAQLASIGKAFQTPDDGPIDLDDDPQASSYWTQEQGLHIQTQIIQFLQTLIQPFRSNGAILEAACEVLKTGFRETLPGPFVFPPSVIVDTLTSTPTNNPRLDVAITTAATFISSHMTTSSTALATARSALLAYVCLIIAALAHPATDPEIAHACVDFLARMLPAYTSNVASLNPQTLHSTFAFTLLCLASPDILPKRAAAGLWSALLESSTSASNTDNSSAALSTALVNAFGADLMLILGHAVGGRAARSELDVITEPLRQLFSGSHAAMAKRWLEAALVDPGFPSVRVDEAQKRRFVAQVVGLRGERRTRVVVREFWGTCRGLG